jgi:hypothetical protein
MGARATVRDLLRAGEHSTNPVARLAVRSVRPVAGHYVPLDADGQEADPLPKFDRASRRVDRAPSGTSIYLQASR